MNAEEIFLEAIERESPAERDGLLDRACAGDTTLRQAADDLLASHEAGGNFLEGTLFVAAQGAERQVTGSIIGPYKILQELGEGGFGVVYMAEQVLPVRRLVALKIIKPGMDTKEIIARFEWQTELESRRAASR